MPSSNRNGRVGRPDGMQSCSTPKCFCATNVPISGGDICGYGCKLCSDFQDEGAISHYLFFPSYEVSES